MRCSTRRRRTNRRRSPNERDRSNATPGFKPKKSVALSGVTAGNTALCTVGRSGNDLHYRGYDILEVAETCEFEEIAYLLIHGKLPNVAELAGTRRSSGSARPAGAGARRARAAAGVHASHGRVAHRRVDAGLRAAGEGRPRLPPARARSRITCVASFGSMLCYWYPLVAQRPAHPRRDRGRLGGRALPAPAARRSPPASWVRAMHTSLNLYAEHEFNSSTFTARVIAGTGSDIYSRSPAPSARCADPSMAAPTKSRC
jgi:2-methylcitrate synthase